MRGKRKRAAVASLLVGLFASSVCGFTTSPHRAGTSDAVLDSGRKRPGGGRRAAAATIHITSALLPLRANAAVLLPFRDFTPALLPFRDTVDASEPNFVPLLLFVGFNILVSRGVFGRSVPSFDTPFTRSVEQTVRRAASAEALDGSPLSPEVVDASLPGKNGTAGPFGRGGRPVQMMSVEDDAATDDAAASDDALKVVPTEAEAQPSGFDGGGFAGYLLPYAGGGLLAIALASAAFSYIVLGG